MKNNILLHACCGICSSYPIEHLRELGYEPIVYFYNPNIQPEDEYLMRLAAQKVLCRELNCELIIEKYDTTEFEDVVKGWEGEPEGGLRCQKCFKLRLNQAAIKTKDLGLNVFTTSIVISPHKNLKLISEIGEQIANGQGIKYLNVDFRKKDGFLKTNKIANSLGLYRQNYCGCRFSIR